jgi:hypothetical protein
VTKDDFILLDQDERMTLLWMEGEVIAEKKYYDCNITLFLLDSFYVEVFHNVSAGHISSITLQDNVQILQAYANEVSLAELEKLLQ